VKKVKKKTTSTTSTSLVADDVGSSRVSNDARETKNSKKKPTKVDSETKKNPKRKSSTKISDEGAAPESKATQATVRIPLQPSLVINTISNDTLSNTTVDKDRQFKDDDFLWLEGTPEPDETVFVSVFLCFLFCLEFVLCHGAFHECVL
jgi:hypothetical protein